MTAVAREQGTRRGRRTMPTSGWLLVGVAVGIAAALVAQFAPWPFSGVPHYAAPYVVLLALLGAVAPSPRAAAVTAIACFLAFVLGYYAVVQVTFGDVPRRYAIAWAAAAVTVCPAAAAAVQQARARTAPLQAVVAAVAGAVALSDGAVGGLVRAALGDIPGDFVQPALAVADLVAAGAAIFLVARTAKARLWSVALLVPFGIVATVVGQALHFGPGPYR